MKRSARLAGGLVLGLLWLAALLLLVAARDGGLAWGPTAVRSLPLEQARSSTSRLEPDAPGVRIRGAREGGQAMLLVPTEPFRIDDWPVLGVRLEGAGALHFARVVLVGEDGALVHAPFPGRPNGSHRIDLRRAGLDAGAAYTAIGLWLGPPDYLPAAAAEPVDVRIEALTLERPGLAAALQMLGQSWLGYRPWTGRSLNTAGFEHGPRPPPGLQLVLAAWLAGMLPILHGMRAGRRCGRPLVLGALGVLALVAVLDLDRRAATALAAARAARPGIELSALPALETELAGLVRAWRDDPPRRVLVWSEDRFLREYPVWLLRSFDAAALDHPGQLDALASAGEGSLRLLLFGASGWRYDRRTGVLELGGRRLAARPGPPGQWFHAFEIAGAGRVGP